MDLGEIEDAIKGEDPQTTKNDRYCKSYAEEKGKKD